MVYLQIFSVGWINLLVESVAGRQESVAGRQESGDRSQEIGDYFIYSPHTPHPTSHFPHPTPRPHEKLFQQTLIMQEVYYRVKD